MVDFVAGQPPVSTGEKGLQFTQIPKSSRLTFSGTSYEKVKESLIKAFGPLPIRLNGGTQLMMLKGMEAASEGPEPYKMLIAALAQAGEIEIKES